MRFVKICVDESMFEVIMPNAGLHQTIGFLGIFEYSLFLCIETAPKFLHFYEHF